jgi:hypothetical protein
MHEAGTTIASAFLILAYHLAFQNRFEIVVVNYEYARPMKTS